MMSDYPTKLKYDMICLPRKPTAPLSYGFAPGRRVSTSRGYFLLM